MSKLNRCGLGLLLLLLMLFTVAPEVTELGGFTQLALGASLAVGLACLLSSRKEKCNES